MPNLIVIAGPNGAGKSTVAPILLQETLGVNEFVNADAIAQGLSAFAPEAVAFQAGRIMLERLQQLANQRANFAFETTLASRTFAPWIANLRQAGYVFYLLFLWLPSPEVAIARVQQRVREGGHNVPEETIRRRYNSGIQNFFQLYQPLADSWRFYDNSNPAETCLIASGRGIIEEVIYENSTWGNIKKVFS
ncbi:zeta toxin family protein [Aerosakkonema funiforme]|uniref:UDP-N-acetylglucosamine kinase n=2 Tax=Oscillatoriophycideae TaxID=1301283 RepID=A0A926ZK84_9CYAN|nr:zeta toxin family protein [Aerosakkonema funiforme]MBD2186353.1 AAA family ATPase [Aerosakkonema funiforme FACHB-1375]